MFYQEVFRTIQSFRINFVVKVLMISDLIVCAAGNLVGPIFAVFVADVVPGGSIEAVGIAAMIYLVTNSVLEIPVAIYVDRTKTQKDDYYTLVIGTLIGAIPFMLYPFVNAVWQIYVLQAVSGAAAALAYPGWSSLFTFYIDKKRAAFEWSLYDVLIGVGMAGAAVLGAFLAERFGFPLVFSIIGVLTALGAGILFALQKHIKIKVAKNKK